MDLFVVISIMYKLRSKLLLINAKWLLSEILKDLKFPLDNVSATIEVLRFKSKFIIR